MWNSKLVLLVLSILHLLLSGVYFPHDVFAILKVQISKSGKENFHLSRGFSKFAFCLRDIG